MSLPLLLLLIPVLLLIGLIVTSRLVTRANQKKRAQEAFTRYLEIVFEWSADRSNLSLTAQAMQAIDEHTATLEQWRDSRKEKYRLQRAERDYLMAYVQLQHRHNQMLKKSLTSPQDKDATLALTFRDAVLSLTATSRMPAGRPGNA